jgi:two-component system heavy metal sensor histidine kinase CusS
MKSIALRLTLMFAATAAAVFILSGFLLHFALREVLAEDVRDALSLRTLERFKLAFIGIAVAGSALMAGLGGWIARVGLQPIETLSKQARSIVPCQPLRRLQVEGVPTELRDLSASFNGALDRLEASYRQLEAFNADVAHELRTPLMNLIGQTQVTLSRPRTCEAFQETLQSNLEELERLRSIVNDMLFLARADQGATTREAQPVWLASEVRQVADFLDVLIDEKQIVLRIEGDTREPIESALFRRAASNLLINAIEHSAVGAEIVVGIERAQEVARIGVSNAGPAIEARHLEHLFDRFYRVEACRRNSTANHGLGLAIVKAIATMHGGTVFASSAAGTNTFGFTVASKR